MAESCLQIGRTAFAHDKYSTQYVYSEWLPRYMMTAHIPPDEVAAQERRPECQDANGGLEGLPLGARIIQQNLQASLTTHFRYHNADKTVQPFLSDLSTGAGARMRTADCAYDAPTSSKFRHGASVHSTSASSNVGGLD